MGSSWVDSGFSCCAQLMTSILVWRGTCCALGLGSVDGSGQNAVGGTTQVHVTAEMSEDRRDGGQLWGWLLLWALGSCQAVAEGKVSEVRERSPLQARCLMFRLGEQGQRSWNGRSSWQLGPGSVHRQWLTSAGVFLQPVVTWPLAVPAQGCPSGAGMDKALITWLPAGPHDASHSPALLSCPECEGSVPRGFMC